MKGLARGQRASGDLIPWTIAQQVRECGCGCSRCVCVWVFKVDVIDLWVNVCF